MDPAAMQVLYHVLEARTKGSTDTVELPGADLRGAQLMRADLHGADLAAAGLDHASLAGAKLGHAKLSETLLRWTDLGGADLTGADLRGADLSWARLEGASLADADLRGAALEGAVGEPASVAGARFDKETCERSRLRDEDVIKVWHAGAVLEDLDEFSETVQRACSAESAELESEAGPPSRALSDLERRARVHRMREDDVTPPSARFSKEAAQLAHAVISGDTLPPISTRSLRLVSSTLTPEMIAAPSWQKGDRVLGVELDSLIGRGNSGLVWAGTNDDGQKLAVKLFDTPRAAEGLYLSSYRRGVSVMNRLAAARLPGVSCLHATSLNQLGIAMDYAPNGSSADLPALRWQVKSVLGFFDKLCAAVRAAHELGVLHRCLKPSNVLLDEDLNPMLVDFDMVDLPTVAAKAQNAGGYAAYAAPEELLGSGTQSPTADIYSLGRMLYFLLKGAEPEEKVADVPALDELAKQPAGLIRIVRKCTLRRPEARYQQMDELTADLANYEDYHAVGVAGGAAEANYLPYRVSALRHRTVWLGDAGMAQRERALREDAKSAPPRRRARRRRPDKDELPPAMLPRSQEKIIGTLGVVLVLVSMIAVEFSNAPTSGLVAKMHMLSAAAGLGVFLIPRFSQRPGLMRMLIGLAFAIGVYYLNLPALFVPASGLAP